MSRKYEVGEILDVTVEKIVPRGLGLAFAEDLTVFVSLAAPGDRLRVRITNIKRRTSFAEIVEVIEPSPDRIVPPCEYFGTCGGCDLQQIDYRTQLAVKVAIVRDCLERLGKIEFEGEIAIVPSPNEFEYRSRAKWHLDRIEQKIGYFQRDTHDVIDVAECPILTTDLQAALTTLRANIDWAMLWDDSAEAEAVSGDHGEVSVFSAEMAEPTTEITVTAAGEEYSFSARSFFQSNRFLIDKLVAAAIDGAVGMTALDLYCGVGLFALPLARKFGSVIGVEDNTVAVAFAKKNAARAGLKNLEFRRAGVKDFLYSSNVAATDLILIDPPRSGAEKGTIEKIASIKPKAISYVSCEPSILARDLPVLLAAGYKIDKITAIDFFPQTHHVETVARLSAN